MNAASAIVRESTAPHLPAEPLLREPEALRPWITRMEGRYVQLSEDLFSSPSGEPHQPHELRAAGHRLALLLQELPPFYAHFGGVGDALLLLSTFYDQHPDAVVFSHPNSIGATQTLFDAFPRLSKIYFLPRHAAPFFHIVLRFAVHELKNCLGAGTTPRDAYEVEWKAGLDIEKKYRVNKSPRWAAAFRQNAGSKQIAVAPKGSLTGMVGSKRNLISPDLWPQVIGHIIERGFEPVILGVPSEREHYPALAGCRDARDENFHGQMRSIGRCAGLVGADSWAKTFSALADIPTLVFEPVKGADLATWKDPSDWVFIEPWPAIQMIKSFGQFCRVFAARIADIPNSPPWEISKPVVAWEGSFLDYGSLSHVNRELSSRLAAMLDLTRVGVNVLNTRAASNPAMRQIATELAVKPRPDTTVTVRHQWPPNWSRPAKGLLVVIQPWEYGALPKAWIPMAANVDEFWVPSPVVRTMYVNSGIAPEKVRVLPNGVDMEKYHPSVRPLPLATGKTFKFLFVGGTIFRKGPEILLEAFSRAFTAADDVCLVIKDFGGDSFYRGQTAAAAIRALQKTPGAPEILYLNEELEDAEMASLYTACDCLVLPYRGEGFGMPVLEAMACGLPVIVTAGGATDSFVPAEAGWKIASRVLHLGDHVGEIPLVTNGWMLEPDKADLISIMKFAAKHRDECRRRGQAGRAFVEKRFDWNDIAAAAVHRLKELSQSFEAAKNPAPLPVKKTFEMKLPAVAGVGRLDEARELRAQNNYQAAWAATATAIAQRPFHPEAFLLLAEIALAAGGGRMAKLCANHSRKLAPGWKAARDFLRQPLKGDAKPDWLPASAVPVFHAAPRLSVCLIARSEERFLARCLKSIHALASQIIVVDTGSTDRTVEIAKEFGAEIYAFKWCDDFGAARNAALEHARGDWVLILDADEELPADQHARLLSDLKKPDVMGFRLPLVNSGLEAEGHHFVPRLFRNAPGAFFQGRVHEQVFSSFLPAAKLWGLKTALGSARLLHHGYTRELTRDRDKVGRNLKLLRLAVAENPADANLLMNFGLELARSGDVSASVEQYRAAFDVLSAQPASSVTPELRETLLAQFTTQLYKLRQHHEVVRIMTSSLAKMDGGLTASLHFALGLAQFELRQFREAADQMRQCIAKRAQPAHAPVNTDIHTVAPEHCLALSLARAGDVAGAEKIFQRMLRDVSVNGDQAERMKLDYTRFLAEQNRGLDALRFLHEMIASNPRQPAVWRLGSEIALSHPDFLDFALDWTDEALKHQADDPVLLSRRAEAMLLGQDIAGARILWGRICERERGPRAVAALILCGLAEESVSTFIPTSESEEAACSREFIAWYQKLIGMKANLVILRLNQSVETLSLTLPKAAMVLKAALGEAALAA